MAEVTIGGFTYLQEYVIEQDGELCGPFGGLVQAHTFAIERLDLPYTFRALNTWALSPSPERDSCQSRQDDN